jgi:hypothetical protein
MMATKVATWRFLIYIEKAKTRVRQSRRAHHHWWQRQERTILWEPWKRSPLTIFQVGSVIDFFSSGRSRPMRKSELINLVGQALLCNQTHFSYFLYSMDTYKMTKPSAKNLHGPAHGDACVSSSMPRKRYAKWLFKIVTQLNTWYQFHLSHSLRWGGHDQKLAAVVYTWFVPLSTGALKRVWMMSANLSYSTVQYYSTRTVNVPVRLCKYCTVQ